MKKRHLSIIVALVLACITPIFASNSIKTDVVHIADGEGEITVNAYLERSDFRTIQFDIELPAGVTLKKQNGAPVASLGFSGTDHQIVTKVKEESAMRRWYRVLIYSMTNTAIPSGNVALASLTVQGSDGLKFGQDMTDGKVENIVLSYKSGSNSSVSVNVDEQALSMYVMAKDRYGVWLESSNGHEVDVIKALRAMIPGLGLRDAKTLADSAPLYVLEDVVKDEAQAMVNAVNAAGGTAYLKIMRAETLNDGVSYTETSDKEGVYVTYIRSFEEKRVGKLQAWFVPFDYTITSADESKFTFYKINMIVNSPDPSVAVSNDIWVYLKPIGAGDVLHANMPYVYKPKVAVTDYKFTTENATLKAKNTEALLTMMTAEDTYTVYGTYDKIKATTSDQFYYVNVNGGLSLGTSVTVGANRWIVRKASKFGGSTAYGKATFIVEGEDDSVVTGITNLANEDAENTWYTLDGVKLNGKPSKKGVYIVNGKKTVIQ